MTSSRVQSQYKSRLKLHPNLVEMPGLSSEHYLMGCALAYTYGYKLSLMDISATVAAISRTEFECQPDILEGNWSDVRRRMPTERDELRRLLVKLEHVAREIYYRNVHDNICLLTLTDPLNIHGPKGDETTQPSGLLSRSYGWNRAIMTLAFLNVRVEPEERRTPTLRELAFPLLCCWHDITEQRPGRWIVPPGEDRPAIGTAGGFIVDGLLAAGWNFTIDEIAAEYKPLRDKLNRLIRKSAT